LTLISRTNKKNDNAHIEQKNWTHVRKFIGWDRCDSPQALEAITKMGKNTEILEVTFA